MLILFSNIPSRYVEYCLGFSNQSVEYFYEMISTLDYFVYLKKIEDWNFKRSFDLNLILNSIAVESF
jgi:hypothetical protein